MTASFGCLDHAVLKLKDGVNVLCLPNEKGKSTWSAFLLAMFYGIDSGERAGKGRLPVKEKYRPWSGAPMEGTLLLEHRGRRLVLQRTSERGRPMGAFRAYDPDTGLDVPGLTGENCGETLLGVERAVFQRSAFLSGADLAVTQDQALARRLGNLASSGEAADSYPAAEARLKTWKNRCRYHKTGLLPEAEARLRQTRETLEAVEDLRRQRLAAVQEQTALEAEAEALAQKDRAEWNARRTAARDALAQANQHAEVQAARTAALPETEALLTLAAKLDRAASAVDVPEAACPPALRGLDAAAILPKAQRDLGEYDRLTAGTEKGGGGYFVTGMLLLAGGAAFLLLRKWLPGAVLLALALPAFGGWLRQRRRNRRVREDLDRAAALLQQYGAEARDELLTLSLAWRDVLQARTRNQRQEWETALAIEEAAAFAPGTADIPSARAAVREALDLRRRDREVQQALEQAQARWQAVSGPTPPENPDLRALRLRCAALAAQAEALKRQEQALGGWEKLDAKRQALEAETDALRQREAALALALEALTAAERQMAQVYAPRLTGLAGDYFRTLTLGRYDGLILMEDFSLLAREAATGLTRPLAALSRGTQDQAWLALRLAMTRLLLPEDAPLVLDDVFGPFDESRTRAALEALAREQRQILIFTCRSLPSPANGKTEP